MRNCMYRFIITVILIFVLLLCASVCFGTETINIYVSTQGADSNDGLSVGTPLNTIAAAKNKANILRTNNPGSVISVNLMGGTYNFMGSVAIAEQNNGLEAPVIYQAYNNDNVVVSSKKSISSSSLVAVTDEGILAKIPEQAHGFVKQVPLSAFGIASWGTQWDYWANNPNNLLYADGELQKIARWPNSGFTHTGSISSKSKPTVFSYTDNRCEKWINSSSARIYGAVEFLWWWQTRRISSIDTQAKTITLVNDNMSYEARKDMPYFVYNLLEELDCEGEYYIDYLAGILYYYPPAGVTEISVSNNQGAIFTLSGARNVTFKGIKFKNSAGKGVYASGCSNISFIDCEFIGFGVVGLNAVNCTNVTVSGCEIYNNGQGGIDISGGNRNTLTSSNNLIENCEIYDTAKFLNSSSYCIKIDGVGTTVSNCKLHDMPQHAIIFSGNNHSIAENEIYNICSLGSDTGAVYAGRDWTQRGNVITQNYFHNIYGYNGGGVNAIYMDDMLSGNEINENVFSFCSNGVFIHGGRDTKVENNLFVLCKNGSIIIVDFSNIGNPEYFNKTTGTFYVRLNSVPFQSDIWRVQYPQVYDLYYNETDAEVGYPKNNIVQNNIICGSPKVSLSSLARQYGTENNNIMRQPILYK